MIAPDLQLKRVPQAAPKDSPSNSGKWRYRSIAVRNSQGLASGIEGFCRRVWQGLSEATFVQKRQVVELLIDRVIVTDGDVEIRYVVPTHPRAEQTRFCHLRLDYRAGP
jgi:hypothetical protein